MGNSSVAAASTAAALTSTESGLCPPNARLARLGPILMPLVMPPKAAAIALDTPRRTSRRSSPARSSPGRLASLAQSSASIEAMIASASALDTINSHDRSSGSAIASPEKSTSTVRIAALAVGGPMTGPSMLESPTRASPQ